MPAPETLEKFCVCHLSENIEHAGGWDDDAVAWLPAFAPEVGS